MSLTASTMKTCTICEQPFPPVLSTQRVCSLKCARVHGEREAIRKAERERLKAEREFRAETKRRRERLKTKAEWEREAEREFNKWIRIRDYGKPCISCDRSIEEIERGQSWKTGGAWDAGHFRSVGSAKHLRFNTWNVHRQCKSCNSGERHENNGKREEVRAKYRLGLIDRIGLERVEALENNNQTRKFSVNYLKRVKRIFSKRARLYRKLRGLA